MSVDCWEDIASFPRQTALSTSLSTTNSLRPSEGRKGGRREVLGERLTEELLLMTLKIYYSSSSLSQHISLLTHLLLTVPFSFPFSLTSLSTVARDNRKRDDRKGDKGKRERNSQYYIISYVEISVCLLIFPFPWETDTCRDHRIFPSPFPSRPSKGQGLGAKVGKGRS